MPVAALGGVCFSSCCMMFDVPVSPKLDTAVFLARFICRDHEPFVSVLKADKVFSFFSKRS